MSRPVDIGFAKPGDHQAAASVLAASFADLTPCHYLMPSIGIAEHPDIARMRRASKLEIKFSALAEHAIYDGGTVYIARSTSTGKVVGSAVWMRYSLPHEPAGYDDMIEGIAGPHSDRFRQFDELLAELAKPQPPHDYLAMLGVAPGWQRWGIGSALLKFSHQSLYPDPGAGREAMPAFLITPSMRLVEFYRRFGYEATCDVADPPRLPWGDPMYPMLRRAVPDSNVSPA